MSMGRLKQPTPAPVTPALPNPVTPGMTNNISRMGTPTTPPAQKLPPLPNLIQDQPLPNPTTPQYNDAMAAYQKALADLQANQQAMLGLQAQYNRLASTDPTARLMQRMMGQFNGDPYADLRAQMNQMNAVPQRLNQAFYPLGY